MDEADAWSRLARTASDRYREVLKERSYHSSGDWKLAAPKPFCVRSHRSIVFSAGHAVVDSQREQYHDAAQLCLPKAGRDHESALRVAQKYAKIVTDLANKLVSEEGLLEPENSASSVFDGVVTFLVDHVSGSASLTTNSVMVHLLCEGCWSLQEGGYELRQPKK